MSSKNVREKILSDLLMQIAKKKEMLDYDITLQELPCTGDNYTAAIYHIQVKDKHKGDLDLFAKVAKAGQIERDAFQLAEMYGRERFMYEVLVHKFNKLQDKYHICNKDRYVFPKFYASNVKVMEETLILEKLQDYHTPDRFEPMDWMFASRAVSQLAKFHALSYALEKEDPAFYAEFIKTKKEYIYTSHSPAEDVQVKYIKGRIDAAIEGLSERNAVKFKAFVERHNPCDGHHEHYQPQSHPCLVHGDYKHTNLLLKFENSRIAEVLPVDYQAVHYGSPVLDLMYFIFTGSDEKFREHHYNDLIGLYYNSLTKCLAQFSLRVKDIYPGKAFDADVKERTLYGLYLGMFILPYMLAVRKPDFSVKDEAITIQHGIEYKERFNGIVNDFVRWGHLY